MTSRREIASSESPHLPSLSRFKKRDSPLFQSKPFSWDWYCMRYLPTPLQCQRVLDNGLTDRPYSGDGGRWIEHWAIQCRAHRRVRLHAVNVRFCGVRANRLSPSATGGRRYREACILDGIAFHVNTWHQRLAGEATALGRLASTGETPVPHSIVNCSKAANASAARTRNRLRRRPARRTNENDVCPRRQRRSRMPNRAGGRHL